MKTKSAFNPNPAQPRRNSDSIPQVAAVDKMAENLAAFYMAAKWMWRDKAQLAGMAAAATIPTEVERLYGQGPMVFSISPRYPSLEWVCPLGRKSVGTVATVPDNSVLLHKRYVEGRTFYGYYAPGTRFKMVSKGSPRDESVWEVLPPA